MAAFFYDSMLIARPDITKQPPSILSSFLGFHALSKRFPFIRNPRFSSPPVSGMPSDRVWRGLARYRNTGDDQPRLPTREEREYAKVTELVNAASVGLTYYADTPGEWFIASLELSADCQDPSPPCQKLRPSTRQTSLATSSRPRSTA